MYQAFVMKIGNTAMNKTVIIPNFSLIVANSIFIFPPVFGGMEYK